MITIIDNGGANLSSIIFSLRRLGFSATLSSDAASIKNASHVILPALTTADSAMKRLSQHSLIEVVRSLTQPVLGICLGMQLLFDFSEEGNIPCFALIPGRVKRFIPADDKIVPHMGWNALTVIKENSLLKNIPKVAYVYYVHSYYTDINQHTLGTTTYGETFSAVVQHNNFFGTQFHPEKTGELGAQILKNFLEL